MNRGNCCKSQLVEGGVVFCSNIASCFSLDKPSQLVEKVVERDVEKEVEKEVDKEVERSGGHRVTFKEQDEVASQDRDGTFKVGLGKGIEQEQEQGDQVNWGTGT